MTRIAIIVFVQQVFDGPKSVVFHWANGNGWKFHFVNWNLSHWGDVRSPLPALKRFWVWKAKTDLFHSFLWPRLSLHVSLCVLKVSTVIYLHAVLDLHDGYDDESRDNANPNASCPKGFGGGQQVGAVDSGVATEIHEKFLPTLILFFLFPLFSHIAKLGRWILGSCVRDACYIVTNAKKGGGVSLLLTSTVVNIQLCFLTVSDVWHY